ncbi:hypothetical protein COT60_01360 [Candidatus Pacearchaeota archaeon CG09_land_8_20_14_0_10_30_9]|nr:MAG: hypothetical protein AUJ61_02700 [Candidatus Pacearchaeota archaeon CG1_02_30_18]PIN71282.1 MAG: hypothetical protein COV77_02965 [Candidatus Pacearchaeota archaeon CG11_big_fil_rev_8_21_14_0_20_30_13]PIO01266.1 MAG: hypothetical protein COT60_01360 [Candidatus Pacearchaeota archaeon CG09_land_8_20_14_0_10_30_9]PIZ81955.1 MAG: hypothetical protein COX98_01620 [Candidatus Pacearchaeota archaeon CG_4_10_14_0_2_um_filter_30_11]PJA71578.1 MAG: hypothetical protein CO153_00820 [Candidatus Pa
MIFGAAIGNVVYRSKQEIYEKVGKAYFKLEEKDPKNELLNLININKKDPIKHIKITKELEEKYPFTPEEKEKISFYLFESVNLLEKYLSDLEKSLLD